MTSLHRLRQAVSPENGRPPVLPPKAVRASLGQYGVSATEQLLTANSLTREYGGGVRNGGFEHITDPNIRQEFESHYTTYQRIFEGGGITMPAPQELSAGGIDFTRLAELKESHPDHNLVVAPLTLSLEQLRQAVSSVTNDHTIPNNPLKKYAATRTDSDGLWVSGDVVSHWDDIMTVTTQEWQLPATKVVQQASPTNSPLSWTAFLLPSPEPDRLGVSFRFLQQQSVLAVPIVGYIAYQMRRITDGQAPVDQQTTTWAQGEFRNDIGFACVPDLGWSCLSGRARVGWSGAGGSFVYLGVRSPIG